MYFISMYSVLNTLSEYTYQKTLLRALFCLFLKSLKAFSVSLNHFWPMFFSNHLKISKPRSFERISGDIERECRLKMNYYDLLFLVKHKQWYIFWHLNFSIFSKHVVEQKKWFISISYSNSLIPAQKIDSENSLQQSFATLSKLMTFRYICVTSERSGYSS